MPKKTQRHRKVAHASRHSFAKSFAPTDQFVTFTYAGTVNTTATANYYLYQLRGNSLYDPDFTSAGAQPVGFDEWAALYSTYRVYESDIEVKFSTTSGVLNAAIMTTTAGGASGFPSTPSYDAAASYIGSVSAQASGGGPAARIHKRTIVAKAFGVDPITVEGDDNYRASVGANPSKTICYSLVFDHGTAAGTVQFSWVIRYKTRLFQPQVLTLSLTTPTRRAIAGSGADEPAASNSAGCANERHHNDPASDPRDFSTVTQCPGRSAARTNPPNCFHPSCAHNAC